jgi:hypothetical protein
MKPRSVSLRLPTRAAALTLASLGAVAFAAAWACRRVPEPAAPPPAAAAVRETTPPAPVEDESYGLRPAEKAAIAAFLRLHTDLRAATDDDRRPSIDGQDVAALYGVYHPYFVRGDANDDGLLDFVIAFVRRDSDEETPWFSVAVFAGEPRGGFAPGVFLERDISLADGDISLDRDAVVVTPDVSDDAARRYRWDPERRRHVYVSDLPDEPPSPPAAQT